MGWIGWGEWRGERTIVREGKGDWDRVGDKRAIVIKTNGERKSDGGKGSERVSRSFVSFDYDVSCVQGGFARASAAVEEGAEGDGCGSG